MHSSEPQQTNRIRLNLHAVEGKVRLADLLVFLERISGCLAAVDRAVNGRSTNYYNVSDLQYGSAVVELEERIQAKQRTKRRHISSAVASFHELLKSTELAARPPWASGDVLKKIRLLSDPLPHGSSARVAMKDYSLVIDDRFRTKIDELLSPDTASEGEFTGRLDAINMHGRRHAYLYPLFGHQKVVCDFSSQSDSTVVSALQRRVRVIGKLSRRSGDPFPYHVVARSIEVLPPDDELPTLRSLRGTLIPTFEGSSTELQRRLRNASTS